MRRRRFIAGLTGGAFALLRRAQAQQPAIPVIGFLSLRSAGTNSTVYDAFLRGLDEEGFVVGRNVIIEYRWAAGESDRFPALAADLVRSKVAVIVAAGGNPSALAAKAATSEIPIVFQMGADPVKLGFIASLDRPGGNLTGVTSLNVEMGAKRLELLHEVIPQAMVLGLLVNPKNAASELLATEARDMARSLGVELRVLTASSESDLCAAFVRFVQLGVHGLVIGNDPFFSLQSEQIARLCTRHALASIATRREYTEAGGLMSYGGSLSEVFRLTGMYAGRILNGERPAEMPVHKATKLEFVVNRRVAKALGIGLPASVLGLADEVFE